VAEQNRQNRTGKQNRLNMTDRKGQAKWDRQNRTGRTGQAEKGRQNRTGKIGLPGQD
jgi:hypothetical protein